MKNLITDIEGILVGCAEDHKFSTGVTVLSGPSPFTAAVDVRGGGAGTRETEILKLESSIGRVDAIVLSGGSAFGLDASSEVQKLLLEEGKGYKVKDHSIPLVSSAVIFDLIQQDNYWKNNVSIWRILANKAYKNLSDNFLLDLFDVCCLIVFVFYQNQIFQSVLPFCLPFLNNFFCFL